MNRTCTALAAIAIAAAALFAGAGLASADPNPSAGCGPTAVDSYYMRNSEGVWTFTCIYPQRDQSKIKHEDAYSNKSLNTVVEQGSGSGAWKTGDTSKD